MIWVWTKDYPNLAISCFGLTANKLKWSSFYLYYDGEEYSEPGLGPQVIKDEEDQRIRRLKNREN